MDPVCILLADGHLLVREGTRRILEREPQFCVVAEADDGQEALRLAEEWHPDLAILDSSMSVLNGIEVTRQIKRISPQTAILVLTAYDDTQYISAILEAGATGYLLKNARNSELIEAVWRIASGPGVLRKYPRTHRPAGLETSA